MKMKKEGNITKTQEELAALMEIVTAAIEGLKSRHLAWRRVDQDEAERIRRQQQKVARAFGQPRSGGSGTGKPTHLQKSNDIAAWLAALPYADGAGGEEAA